MQHRYKCTSSVKSQESREERASFMLKAFPHMKLLKWKQSIILTEATRFKQEPFVTVWGLCNVVCHNRWLKWPLLFYKSSVGLWTLEANGLELINRSNRASNKYAWQAMPLPVRMSSVSDMPNVSDYLKKVNHHQQIHNEKNTLINKPNQPTKNHKHHEIFLCFQMIFVLFCSNVKLLCFKIELMLHAHFCYLFPKYNLLE